MPKLSVIVPVYNTEKYLPRCIASLKAQTLNDIELIFVDDASTDNSAKILEELKDCKIVVQPKNQGLGSARNTGIAVTTGDYIGFVDSDDCVHADMFRLLYERAIRDDADVVICDTFRVNGNYKRFYPGYRRFAKPFPRTVRDFVAASTDPAYAWNKIYKRELWDGLCFTDGWFEDLATVPLAIARAKKVSYLRKPLYYYQRNEDSITSNEDDLRNLDVINAWNRILTECPEEYLPEMRIAVKKSVRLFCRFRKNFKREFMEFMRTELK